MHVISYNRYFHKNYQVYLLFKVDLQQYLYHVDRNLLLIGRKVHPDH